MKNVPNGVIIIGLTITSWAIVFLILHIIITLITPTTPVVKKVGVNEVDFPTNITGVY